MLKTSSDMEKKLRFRSNTKYIIAVYLVTWKTFQAVLGPSTVDFANDKDLKVQPTCVLESVYHQKEFYNWIEAYKLSTSIKEDKTNYDVKIWELDEPVKKQDKN